MGSRPGAQPALLGAVLDWCAGASDCDRSVIGIISWPLDKGCAHAVPPHLCDLLALVVGLLGLPALPTGGQLHIHLPQEADATPPREHAFQEHRLKVAADAPTCYGGTHSMTFSVTLVAPNDAGVQQFTEKETFEVGEG